MNFDEWSHFDEFSYEFGSNSSYENFVSKLDPKSFFSWKLCNQANHCVNQNDFLVNQISEVTYVAFSGIQSFDGLDPSCKNMISLDANGGVNRIFSAFQHQGDDGEEPIKVHGEFVYILFMEDFCIYYCLWITVPLS